MSNSYPAQAFVDAFVTYGGTTNPVTGITRTNQGGGIGRGVMTYDKATNLFNIMRDYQRGLQRNVD